MMPAPDRDCRFGLFMAVAGLLIGTIIYLVSRPDEIYLNQFIASVFPGTVLWAQSIFDLTILPRWILHSLPDGLWMFAFVVVMLSVWQYRIDHKSLPWLLLVFVIGLVYETGQGVNWIPGTFDIMDLVLMMIGALIPFSISYIKFNLCKN